MNVRGVIESDRSRLKVTGLSGFGTTIFQISENFITGEIEKEFHYDSLKRNEEKVMFFYTLMKRLLAIPKGKQQFEQDGAQFTLQNQDQNRIFRLVTVEHKDLNLNIEVSDYEL